MRERTACIAVVTIAFALVRTVGIPSAQSSEPRSRDWTVPAREAAKTNPIPADGNSIARGKVVYRANCLSCHGPAGKGDGPKAAELELKPRDLSSSEVKGQSDGALWWKIAEGRKPMPAFRKLVSDADRWNVVNYLRTLGSGNAKKP